MKMKKIRKRLLASLAAFAKNLLGITPKQSGIRVYPVIPAQDCQPSIVMENKLLWGKNVLVTGAGRNIGRSIALEMGRQGANIFFTDIDADRCSHVERELQDIGVKAKGFVSDISNVNESDGVYESLVQSHTVIDVLVNNVGIHCEREGIDYIEKDWWDKTFHTNVFGPMYLTRCISQMMKQNNICGNIIFLSSIHQFTPSRSMSYSSSKAALGIIIKELALELAGNNIRVNGIAPGWVKVDEQGNPYTFTFAPLHGSTIHPCYIGRAAVYLASEFFSEFTTGTLITIDAGLSLHNRLLEPYPPARAH
jgi:NAD(P)-dependent dehydrogenase (short-subunit alcohol dehydrogenase family)